jgi:hypothetical protein
VSKVNWVLLRNGERHPFFDREAKGMVVSMEGRMIMDIFQIIELLKSKRSVFHSEADFKFALAWEIKEFYKNCRETLSVQLEYPCQMLLADSQVDKMGRKYFDILVRLNDAVYPIELKYKTEEFEVKIFRENHEELFQLRKHSAPNLGRYSFVEDLYRLEAFSFSDHIKKIGNFRKGYAIWLGNDPDYWKEPTRCVKARDKKFRIHEGAILEAAKYHYKKKSTKKKNIEKEFILKHEYVIHWNDYSNLSEYASKSNKYCNFKYAITVVPPVAV